MDLKIIPATDSEFYKVITQKVKDNDGYCPCKIFKNVDTKCMCKEFRDLDTEGTCHCGRFLKVKA